MASHSNPLKRPASIERYYGFKETANRFLFPYEDHFKVAPKLSVILPTGVVENEKTLVPKPGKGVIAYVYEQTVNPDLVEEYLKTPFVREATEDGSRRTLVQAWPTNFNDTFKKDYKIYTKNPNPLVFKETVKRSFQTAMCELFEFAPDDSSAPKVLYCHKASKNDSDVLVGTTKQLIDHLKGNAQDRIDMGIVSLSADGFVTQMVDKNGVKTGTKPFTMTPGKKYALYMKKADITMACATLFEQFMDGRELFKEIALDKEEDDASTEPYETDEDTDEDNEIGDGLSSDRETNESLLASAPNLLGNLTRAVSELKDREAETAAKSSTKLTRSPGNANFFDEGNNDPEMFGEPEMDEDELHDFAPSKDDLLDTAQRMVLDGFNCTDLPTVVVENNKTDAKMAAEPEIGGSAVREHLDEGNLPLEVEDSRGTFLADSESMDAETAPKRPYPGDTFGTLPATGAMKPTTEDVEEWRNMRRKLGHAARAFAERPPWTAEEESRATWSAPLPWNTDKKSMEAALKHAVNMEQQ